MTDQKFTSAFQGSMTAGILGMLVLDLIDCSRRRLYALS